MSTPTEWNLLKDQFDALVHDEIVDADSIEKAFDEQVRRRFAEMINRAAEPRKQNRDGWLVPAIARRFER